MASDFCSLHLVKTTSAALAAVPVDTNNNHLDGFDTENKESDEYETRAEVIRNTVPTQPVTGQTV